MKAENPTTNEVSKDTKLVEAEKPQREFTKLEFVSFMVGMGVTAAVVEYALISVFGGCP